MFVIEYDGKFYGPFKSADQAAKWAEPAFSSFTWRIVMLKKPFAQPRER